MILAYISHPDCAKHDMGPSHPERPARLIAVEDAINNSVIKNHLQHFEPPFATLEQLKRVHDETYVEKIFSEAPEEDILVIDEDTVMTPYTLPAALRAAGAGILATNLVLQNKVKYAFCNVRPPGHHAERARAMGFSFFNNVAVAVAHALEEYDIKRIAIVDFDVHHGNGTEDIFKNEKRVLLCSSFQHPFYPFSGDAVEKKNLANILLPAGSRGGLFRKKVEEVWLPTLKKFKPELIYFSAGFDAHEDDPLANLRFREEDYLWVTREIKKIVDVSAQGRMISMLEGGYALEALGNSVVGHLLGMME